VYEQIYELALSMRRSLTRQALQDVIYVIQLHRTALANRFEPHGPISICWSIKRDSNANLLGRHLTFQPGDSNASLIPLDCCQNWHLQGWQE